MKLKVFSVLVFAACAGNAAMAPAATVLSPEEQEAHDLALAIKRSLEDYSAVPHPSRPESSAAPARAPSAPAAAQAATGFGAPQDPDREAGEAKRAVSYLYTYPHAGEEDKRAAVSAVWNRLQTLRAAFPQAQDFRQQSQISMESNYLCSVNSFNHLFIGGEKVNVGPEVEMPTLSRGFFQVSSSQKRSVNGQLAQNTSQTQIRETHNGQVVREELYDSAVPFQLPHAFWGGQGQEDFNRP